VVEEVHEEAREEVLDEVGEVDVVVLLVHRRGGQAAEVVRLLFPYSIKVTERKAMRVEK
jgi:hypothetical protein